MKLLSDQVNEREISIILRELAMIIKDDIKGDVVEFGCYVGTTSVHLARNLPMDRSLWLYDSFEGLPEKDSQDESPTGVQFMPGELYASKKQLEVTMRKVTSHRPRIKKAWFKDLTPNDIPRQISLAFLDGDFYYSIRDSLALIWEHLTPGACIIIDDYANEALPGAATAVNEWSQQHHLSIKVEHSLAIMHKPID